MAGNPNAGAQLSAVNLNSVGFVPQQAVGATLLNTGLVNVQHAFDRVFFYNTANLAGQILTFFQVPVAGTYNVLNGAPTQFTKGAADTNWDQQNQAQYSYLFTGMYLKFQTLTQQSFLASPLDLTTWPDYLRSLVEDSSISIVSEDMTLMRQKSVHIPEGNAVTGFNGVTGSNTVPIGQPIVSSGAPFASNIFSFGKMALWVPKGSRFNVNLTFGASLLVGAAAYIPPTSAPAKIFAEIRFQGVKVQIQ